MSSMFEHLRSKDVGTLARLSYSAEARQSNSSKAVRTRWIITLGDFLTLLLGFFISTVSLSPLNKAVSRAQPAKTTEESRQIQTSAANQNSSAKSGTQVAIIQDELNAQGERLIISGLRFTESDFLNAQPGGLNDGAVQRLKGELNKRLTKLKGVLIEVCAGTEKRSVESKGTDRWFMSINRILAIRSQLIDSGVSADLIRSRVLGTQCGLLRTSAGDKTSGKVQFETQRGEKLHG